MSGPFRTALEVFRIRNYRLFWFGGLISNIGRWFQTVAVPIVVFDLTGSAAWVGLAGFAQIMKGLEQFDDDLLTVDWAIDNIVIAGSPATVTEQLLAVREEVGPFGTIVLTGLDWDEPAVWKRSMELMANEVMPKLRAATGSAAAAE